MIHLTYRPMVVLAFLISLLLFTFSTKIRKNVLRLVVRIQRGLARWTVVLPEHKNFKSLVHPLFFATLFAIFGLVIAKSLSTSGDGLDSLITVLFAIMGFLIGRYRQRSYRRRQYVRKINTFASKIESHPVVAQRFGAYLLGCFLMEPDFMEDAKKIFLPSKGSLSCALAELCNGGLELSETAYVELLNASNRMIPVSVLARWDTTIVWPSSVSEIHNNYSKYFDILDPIYRLARKRTKKRLFIFKDEDDLSVKLATPIWREILKIHKEKFDFDGVHILLAKELTQARATPGYRNVDNDIDDFALFSSPFPFMPFFWLIGRSSTNKVVLITNENKAEQIQKIQEFYDHTISEVMRLNKTGLPRYLAL